MPTINEELRDLILRRSHYIYMFENGMIKDMIEPYNRAKLDLMAKIAKLEDYGQGWTLQNRMDRLNSQLREIDVTLKYANDDGIGVVSNYLNEFGQTEKDFYDNLLADKFGTIGIGINRLPIEQIHEIVNTPIGGLKYHERMIKRYDDSMFDIKSNLTQSIIQGEDMAKASRRLLGIGNEMGGVIGSRLMQQSSVIARTEIMRVSNSVAERIYNENTDILKGQQWCATLDGRTCISCGSLDGKIFYFNKNMTPPPRPLHPNCRCVLIPITKSWAELGADKKIQEPDAGTRPFTYTGEKPLPGSRQYKEQIDKWAGDVPETEFYPQWLKRMNGQDPDFVRGILGPKRYDLWQSGKIEFKEMVKGNKILRLDELQDGKIKWKSPSKLLKENPMSSVEGFINCISGIRKESLMELTVSKPNPCVDYTRDENGKWFFKGKEVSGEELIGLKKRGIPPAWKNVVVAADETIKIQAIGLDKAGRWQYRYSVDHIDKAIREKFDRIKLFSRDMPKIRRAIEKGILDGNDLAYLIEIENRTAIRIGSETDFKAKIKAYGLTTLKNEHIKIQGDKIILDFIAKEGKPAHYEIVDKTLSSWLSNKKAMTKVGEDIFPDISANRLNNFLKKISGGDYTVKDFRTYHGTRIAYEELKQYAGKILSDKEKKKIIKEVCEKVSKFLSNTPDMAKKAYIDPMVWEFIGGI